MVSATARAKAWSDDRDKCVDALREAGKIQEAEAFASVPLVEIVNNGGYMSVLEWTGPGIFTDAVFRYVDSQTWDPRVLPPGCLLKTSPLSYLGARYNVTWPALKGLERPLRVGDVIILPRTGFSPGVNGANGMDDPQAMVLHKFAGSWKNWA